LASVRRLGAARNRTALGALKNEAGMRDQNTPTQSPGRIPEAPEMRR
jgi:hypothetical protein